MLIIIVKKPPLVYASMRFIPLNNLMLAYIKGTRHQNYLFNKAKKGKEPCFNYEKGSFYCPQRDFIFLLYVLKMLQ